jgi:hypothetical protein
MGKTIGKALPHAPRAAPGSPAAALATVPDPRRPYGWRPEYAPVPLGALLQATVVAVLCGAQLVRGGATDPRAGGRCARGARGVSLERAFSPLAADG